VAERVTIDAVATLASMEFIRLDAGEDAPTLEIELRVAAGDATGDACAAADPAAAIITGDATFATATVAPATLDAPPAALDALSGNDFTVCATLTSSAPIMFTLEGIVGTVAFGSGCDEPAEDLAGVWTGTYVCDDLCQGDPATEDGDIAITVSQAGQTAIYSDDGGATYFGSVCGAEFRHLGGKAGYWEYGRFTRTGTTSATKSSVWISTMTPDCGGMCEDEVELAP
jgi:hypothetical protein